MARLAAYESPFQVTLKGVAAGLVGTLVMTSGLQLIARLVARPPAPSHDELGPEESFDPVEDVDLAPVPPTEQVAERVASRVFGTAISHETRQRLGVGIHWAYGAFCGALSAQLQLTARPPAIPYGVALGVAVWAVGPARVVPALGLYERPASSGWPGRIVAIGLHVLYGVATALTLERLSTPQ